jgi:hypothetical protein
MTEVFQGIADDVSEQHLLLSTKNALCLGMHTSSLDLYAGVLLSSQGLMTQVLSPLWGLTSVFGMGTGVSPTL